MKLRWALVAACALLAGCAGRAPTPTPVDDGQARQLYVERAAELAAWTEWSFTGRLGLRIDGDGGSGQIEWEETPDRAVLSFRGALGQGAWQLVTSDDGAELTRSDGSVLRAPTADALAMAEVGWPVPVAELSRWVRGLVHQGDDVSRLPVGVALDVRGLPVSLDQGDWQVLFERYSEESGAWLPRKVEASRGDNRVRLAISRWRFSSGEPGAGH
ncbi:outer membrane lipoprotein LolB [Marinihelvus fidelis]|uniref:Outer-membrane lipoprotein LolB n=1 Tax=Marinihelvus fidelis TaxID=2613842 RepID=A0A5N0TBK5_9GAMM|nr:lipoprotein insertase outer membrane protein LolB [Marinihelvus fidelis]KAA9132463.1 outer membrane lipoprotein LolB [Marinihelvus fidelis]